MIIRTAIFILNLLNLFLFFRLLLGCEFRKTRSSAVIGVLLTAGVYVLFLPFLDDFLMELPNITVFLYALLPVVWLKGRKVNLFLLEIIFNMMDFTIGNLVQGIMMVILKDRVWDVWFKFGDSVSIIQKLLMTLIIVSLVVGLKKYKATINEVINSLHPIILFFMAVFIYIFGLKWTYLPSGMRLYVQMKYQGFIFIKDAVTSIISIVLMVGLIIVFYQKKYLNREIMLKNQCIESQTEQYAFMGRANQETHKFRHDFNKHMEVLADLFDHGETEELGQYIHQFVEMKERAYYISTGNMICDAIFNQYYVKCREAGIHLNCSGNFSTGLSVAMTDLCVILSNALNNAYEATCQCLENREIQCKIGNRKDLIFITIFNPAVKPPEFEKGFIETTKPDKENHGFGMKNMQEAAARNGGSVKWRYLAQEKKVMTKICLKNKIM